MERKGQSSCISSLEDKNIDTTINAQDFLTDIKMIINEYGKISTTTESSFIVEFNTNQKFKIILHELK